MQFILGTGDGNYHKYLAQDFAHFTIINDSSTDDIIFSFNGVAIAGIVKPEEGITFHDANIKEIYISGAVGESFRLWFFGKQSVIYPKQELKNAGEQYKPNEPFFNESFIPVKY